MMLNNRCLKRALGVVGLTLILSPALIAQDPGSRNQSVPRPGNNPNAPANNNSNNSGAKLGAQGASINGQTVFGSPPTALPPLNANGIPPNAILPNQFVPYGNVAPGYPPTSYSTSIPAHELMVYQDGEFKVVPSTNDPNQLAEARESAKVLAEAVQALRSESSSESERADAKKTLAKCLRAHFDHDEKKRREQVESLEAQIVKLKTQLEKRTQSKEQLIELRLKLLENDASGLAFPQSWSVLPGMENGGQVLHTYSVAPNSFGGPSPYAGNPYPVPSSNGYNSYNSYPSNDYNGPKDSKEPSRPAPR